MRTPFVIGLCAAIASVAACEVGDALPPNPGPELGPDAGLEEPGVDAGEEPTAAPLSGTVMSWSTGAATPNAQLSTGGITPALTATGDAAGHYELDGVPPDALFTIEVAVAGDLYYPTVNARMRYAGTPMLHDVRVAARADVVRQHAAVGTNMVPGSGFVEATLLKGDGTAREGVPLADLTLTDALGEPVGEGPYLFGALGDLDAALTVSTAYDGRARLAFLNVPPGQYTLTAIYPADGDGGGGGGQAQPKTCAVTSAADTVVLVNVNDKLDGDGGGGGGGGGGGA